MFWRCLRWETLRLEDQAPSNRDRFSLPTCTSRCGIFLEDLESVAWADVELSECVQSTSCNTLPDNDLSDVRFERETQNHDGRCGDRWSMCLSPGREFQKSRLRSILQHRRRQKLLQTQLCRIVSRHCCSEKIGGNLEIRSDSEYVARTATSRIRGETRSAMIRMICGTSSRTVRRLTETRRLELVWVKGHAT